ncbi:MAG: DUF1778 domain-containing protein, partial [Myxococcales bacterium]|nr:DUF1778 domain-containing protein [Myxococcales bacterium]
MSDLSVGSMPTNARSDRLDFRLSPESRRLIERAAAIRGQPLTAFALSTAPQKLVLLRGARNAGLVGPEHLVERGRGPVERMSLAIPC